MQKIRTTIKENQTVKAGVLIGLLNPIIRGWAQFHQHFVSKETFTYVDHQIIKSLLRWTKRRHPKKSKQWIIKRYFRTVGGNHWVFFGEDKGKGLFLLRASQIPIKRHRKVKTEANPFDPSWELYFEKRIGIKLIDNLKGKRQLIQLWKEQRGICPVCKQKITKFTGWHNHHIVWKSKGGSDAQENRVLLHPNCHAQIHVQGISVTKPRPLQGV